MAFILAGRHKGFVHSHHTSPWLAQLHSEYLSLGLSSPWSLKRSCDINQQDAYGRTALHYATEQGHSYIVHMLIKSGTGFFLYVYLYLINLLMLDSRKVKRFVSFGLFFYTALWFSQLKVTSVS